MILTKKQLEEEKEVLRKEIDNCNKCRVEESLGFNYCEYHRSIIKYLKKQKIVNSGELI